MIRLLVNNPDTGQQVIEIDDSGSYFDESLVLWDERVDGPLPEIQAGGLVRAGDKLVFSQEIADEDAALKQTILNAVHNAPILAALERNDLKSIRALREGNAERLAAIELEQQQLRLQLIKD